MAGKYNIAKNGYDPFKDIDNIHKLKGEWAAATGEPEKQNEIAKRAQAFYAPLRQNGYADIADKLTAADHQQSKYIRDAFAKYGKTATRPYLTSAGRKYGLSEDAINKLISYDDNTGEVSFAGQSLGRPDTVYDGTSYWNSTEKMDNALAEYAKNAGLHTSPELKWNDTYDTAKLKTDAYLDSGLESRANTNEAEKQALAAQAAYNKEAQTATANSEDYRRVWRDVMPAYEYEADKAGRNAAASGASANSGNIDSFAAANARRQREASLAKGQELAARLGIGARQNTMDNMDRAARGSESLSSTFADNSEKAATDADIASRAYQRLMGETRDERNDEATRGLTNAQTDLTKAQAARTTADTLYRYGEITGQVPLAAMRSIFPNLINEDGTFNDNIHSVDIDNEINQLKEDNKDGKNDSLIKMYENLRYYKLNNFPERYGEFASNGNASPFEFAPYTEEQKNRDLTTYTVDKNAETQKYGIDSEERQNKDNNQTARDVAEANNASNERINSANNDLDWKKSQLAANTDIATTSIAAGLGADGTGTAASALDDDTIGGWIKVINDRFSPKDSEGKKTGDAIEEYEPGKYRLNPKANKYDIIETIAKSSELTPTQKDELYQYLGISSNDVNDYANSPRANTGIVGWDPFRDPNGTDPKKKAPWAL